MEHIEAFRLQGGSSARRRGADPGHRRIGRNTDLHLLGDGDSKCLSEAGDRLFTPGRAISVRGQVQPQSPPLPPHARAGSRHGRGLGRRAGPGLAGRRSDGGHGLRWRRQDRRRDPLGPRWPVSHGLQGVPGLADREPEKRGPVGILNAESTSELERIAHWGSELGVRPRVCLRVNPDVDPHTHEYTTTGKEENKFGIDAPMIPDIFDAWGRTRGSTWWVCTSTSAHRFPRSSPTPRPSRYCCAWSTSSSAEGTRSRCWTWVVAGRSTTSRSEVPPLEDYAERLIPLLGPARPERAYRFLMEPGRSIMANSQESW